ncbi:MAG: thiamine diphosphokinase [Oscillibacter sp.]|jgi:thiamine pyrophosphokinase|nr:thiamine diphosphokinase [Oscillibacter sp.]
MKRCFIFSAGTFYGMRERPASGDLVIAADAGYRTCQKEGIVPDLLLGDFDSMEQPADFQNVLRVPVEKDDTDTMLAIRTAIKEKCGEVYLYGATGGKRMDHTLANLQSLMWICHQGVRGYLYDDDFVYTAIRNETLTIPKTVEWGLVSVFCLSEPAAGITETGMQYSLTDATLRADQPLAVSNHMTEPRASISVRDGTLIVGWQLPPL